MPHYEYHCEKCGKDFEKFLTIHEAETEKVKCPSCGSTRIEQKFSSFFAVTAKKS